MVALSFLRTRYLWAIVIITLLIVSFAVWYSVQRPVTWHQSEFSHRIPIEISGVNQTSSPANVSVVIPREGLPQSLDDTALDLQLTNDNGAPIDFYRSPARSNAPIVLWWSNLTSEQGRNLLLYLQPVSPDQALDHVVSLSNETPSNPFLLFDTFEDSELSSWEQKPIWYPDEAIFPWMELMPSTSRILPESESGYIIKLMAEDIDTGPGGAAIIVSSGEVAVSWGRVDEKQFQAQVENETLAETTVAVETLPNSPTVLRLDVPGTLGDPIRFILNGELLYETPLPKPITESVRLWLMRRGSEGDTYFRWVAVRPYQQTEPVVKLGEIEIH